MHLPQRFAWRDQSQARAHRRRDRFWQVRIQRLQRRANDAAKPARGQATLPGGLVNGHDASDFQGLCRLFLCPRPIVCRVAQNLKLGLHDLQLVLARVFFYFPVEGDQLTGRELALKVSGVKEYAAQAAATLAHG